MSAPWTPGPWHHAHRMKANGMYSTQVFDVDGQTICHLAWHTKANSETGADTDREENARLIAAAPGLADILAAIVDEFSCTIENYDRNGPDMTCADGEFFHVVAVLDRRELVERARAALAKAKGEAA